MSDWFGLIELLLIFGLILGALAWQLVSVRRETARDAAKRDDPLRRDGQA